MKTLQERIAKRLKDKKRPKENREAQLLLKFNPELKERIRRASRESGISMTEFIIKALKKELIKRTME